MGNSWSEWTSQALSLGFCVCVCILCADSWHMVSPQPCGRERVKEKWKLRQLLFEKRSGDQKWSSDTSRTDLGRMLVMSDIHLMQGSRVRPNFSRVRLTKIPGRTGASSYSRKEKKVSATQKLCGSTKDTPVRLISWSKPIRDSEGRTPPLIGRGPDIPVCVCARWQMRHVCCCSQTERKRWVVEMRAVLPTCG